ncbi:hypothetical protein BWQ96_02618 [Gracilariopsis chorda]|uniref:Uncharacterized protein n=1 Tax=Gracilariopsis chorda TaxID=448386 RepID=A0A2V3IZW6_9FLOR|nr:hypothetical protein BWQ96_02618 [Gracilariopsis chorda]|eukprot:PXF47639.1 hypothetical protein BWQ96_02618 [Gracilariopsis chorda]
MYTAKKRPRHAFAFPVLCSTVPQGVPSNAKSAASQIRQSVRTALISGHRRVCVDVLLAAVDPRARLFDEDAAEVVFNALVESVQPVLPESTELVQVVVPGSAAALRAQKWLARSELKGVVVDVIGAEEHRDARSVLVIDPPTESGVLEFRRFLREAHARGAQVVVHNHPRDDSLYKLLGFGGYLPFEMMRYESAFMLAPFTLQATEGGFNCRFVVMRRFPSA